MNSDGTKHMYQWLKCSLQLSFKFALNPQAAKVMENIFPVTQYDAQERENKSNYSEKLGETRNNVSNQIR